MVEKQSGRSGKTNEEVKSIEYEGYIITSTNLDLQIKFANKRIKEIEENIKDGKHFSKNDLFHLNQQLSFQWGLLQAMENFKNTLTTEKKVLAETNLDEQVEWGGEKVKRFTKV